MRLALALLLAALPAFSAVPEKGEGTITLLGGARIILPSNGAYLDEQGASHKFFQPGGILSFGYQYDDDIHIKIELGYLVDRYDIPGGGLSVRSIPIVVAVDTALFRREWVTLFGGGGIGYSLNTGTRGGADNEANSTGGYLGVGARFKLTSGMALVLEDRFSLFSAQLDPLSQQKLNAGGNMLSLGLMFHFLEPDDKGKPHAP